MTLVINFIVNRSRGRTVLPFSEMSTVRRGGKKEYYCGHCDKVLGRTVFYQHRRLYFHRTSRKWFQRPVNFSGTGSDSAAEFIMSEAEEQQETAFTLDTDSDEGE